MPRTYEIVLDRNIDLDRIRFTETDPPLRPQEAESFVEARWQEVLQQNPSAKDGDLISIRNQDFTFSPDGMLELLYGKTGYRWFVGSTYQTIMEEYGHDSVHYSTAICVVFMDQGREHVIIHLRGRDMAYKRLLHAPGGMLNIPDPSQAIRKEIEEEIGIGYDECPIPKLLGIACDRNEGRWNREFCFQVEVPFTFNEIKKRHAKAIHRDEGILIPIPNTQEVIEAFLELGNEKALDVWVPTGHAALVLHGRSMGWWPETGFPKLISA